MTPSLRPTIATTTPITPRALRPEPRAKASRASTPANREASMVPPMLAPMAATIAAAAHRAVSTSARAVMSTRSPLMAKKTGAKKPAVKVSSRSRTWGNWWRTRARVMPTR